LSFGQSGDPGNALQFVVLQTGADVSSNAMAEKLLISVSVSWIDSKEKLAQSAVLGRARNAGKKSERVAPIMTISNSFQEIVVEFE
jgi:hypothetical protein